MVNKVNVIGAFLLVIIVVAALVLVLVPFVFIWALNTLFTLKIQYTFLTWFAALVLMLILGWHKIIPVYTNVQR